MSPEAQYSTPPGIRHPSPGANCQYWEACRVHLDAPRPNRAPQDAPYPRRCRITPPGFKGRRNPIPNNPNALARESGGQSLPELTAPEADIYCIRTDTREVRDVRSSDVGAVAGVAVEASARRFGLRTAQRGSPSGSVPRGEANFDSTASGVEKPERSGGLSDGPLNTLNRVNGHGAKAPGQTSPGGPRTPHAAEPGQTANQGAREDAHQPA